MITEYFVLTRAVHIGGCLLLFGMFVFDRLVISVGPDGQAEIIRLWRTRLRVGSLALLPVILLSGAVWFVLVAMTMSDLPLGEAIQTENLRAVWSQTRFGTVWQVRAVLWLACLAVAAIPGFAQGETARSKRVVWAELFLSGLLLGGLAWAGHGQEGQPAGFHATADVLHLLVAGFWPTGLLPLAWLLCQSRRSPELGHQHFIAALVRRFSTVSIVSVVGLVVTGWVNSWFLVGTFANLFHEPYGKWLVTKIVLFVLAVAIGAINLLRLKPRLSGNAGNDSERTLGQLQRNVIIELGLSAAIIVVVGILGILAPAVH